VVTGGRAPSRPPSLRQALVVRKRARGLQAIAAAAVLREAVAKLTESVKWNEIGLDRGGPATASGASDGTDLLKPRHLC
jgi:hypothetical protein